MRCCPHDIDSPDIAKPAHRANTPSALRDVVQLLAKPLPVASNRPKQCRIGQATHNVICDRRDEGTTTKRGAVVPRLDRRGDRVIHQHSAHREAAGDWFREREHIRLNAEMLVCEQCPRPAEATLYFIEDERDFSLLGERANLADEAGVENSNAALTLDRLEYHRRGSLGAQR